MKRRTIESFISDATKIHDGRYNYSRAIFNGTKEKICITCSIHGDFMMTPKDHLRNHGCPKCGRAETLAAAYHTQESFIEKATRIHNNFYDYSLVSYTNALESIDIICPIHGVFAQAAKNHLRGHGCNKCGNEFKLGYKESQWKEHCNRYNKASATVYVIRIYNHEEEFIKIGLTAGELSKRFHGKAAMPYEYEVILEVRCDPVNAYRLEKKLHKNYCKHKYSPKIKFNGSTECFCVEILTNFTI